MDGYLNGSDMLLSIEGYMIGSCTSHEIEYKSESKEFKVKPGINELKKNEKFKKNVFVGQSITITADALIFDEDDYNSYELLEVWAQGIAVNVSCFPRKEKITDSNEPYLRGLFIITSLKETHPANDESKYSITLENAGCPEIFNTNNFKPIPVKVQP